MCFESPTCDNTTCFFNCIIERFDATEQLAGVECYDSLINLQNYTTLMNTSEDFVCIIAEELSVKTMFVIIEICDSFPQCRYKLSTQTRSQNQNSLFNVTKDSTRNASLDGLLYKNWLLNDGSMVNTVARFCYNTSYGHLTSINVFYLRSMSGMVIFKLHCKDIFTIGQLFLKFLIKNVLHHELAS